MSVYLVRRVTRPKKGNILIQHHGTQILQVDGQTAVFTYRSADGLVQQIPEPIIDFNADSQVRIQGFAGFAAERKVTPEQPQQMHAADFDRRLASVLQDIRPYDIGTRDCETTTDTLLEGAPKYRQLKQAAGVGLVALAVVLLLRE
jgi:hypothetical protein